MIYGALSVIAALLILILNKIGSDKE